MPTPKGAVPRNALSLRTSNYVRALIAAQGIDQQDFARKVGVGGSHLSKVLNRQRGATLELLERFSRELHRPVAELLDPPDTTAAPDEETRTDSVEGLRSDVAALRDRFDRLERSSVSGGLALYTASASGADPESGRAVMAIVRQIADGVRALLAYAERTTE